MAGTDRIADPVEEPGREVQIGPISQRTKWGPREHSVGARYDRDPDSLVTSGSSVLCGVINGVGIAGIVLDIIARGIDFRQCLERDTLSFPNPGSTWREDATQFAARTIRAFRLPGGAPEVYLVDVCPAKPADRSASARHRRNSGWAGRIVVPHSAKPGFRQFPRYPDAITP